MIDNPITPPPELVGEWLCSEDYLSDASTFSSMTITSSRFQRVATQAARWGADMELEACCKWAAEQDRDFDLELRAARRPKPPSLAKQALDTLRSMQIEPVIINGINVNKDVMDQYSIIRRAFERLQELENNG